MTASLGFALIMTALSASSGGSSQRGLSSHYGRVWNGEERMDAMDFSHVLTLSPLSMVTQRINGGKDSKIEKTDADFLLLGGGRFTGSEH
jgi:hypothetical protein